MDSISRSNEASSTPSPASSSISHQGSYLSSQQTISLSEAQAAKVTQILQACIDGDLNSLITLATSTNGLVVDEIRQTAWPILLGLGSGANGSIESQYQDSWKSLPPHRDEEQVKLDVNRSFVYYPKDKTEKQLERRKEQLSDVITEVLRRHPSLCYFQGYHDIVQVLLLVLGPEKSVPAVARLSLLRIRDFMLPSLTAAIQHLSLLPPILYAADPELFRHLDMPQTQPFFALAATLTLYAHDIEEYGAIARLFDFLLAREAVVSVYLFAVIVISRKSQLVEIPPDEPEMMHSILSKLPKPLDLEFLISQTTDLFTKIPPESLPFKAWRRISPHSVLKTTRNSTDIAKQTLEEGEALFVKQATEIRWDRTKRSIRGMARRWFVTYKRPARAVGIAILVGAFAWWLGRNSGLTGLSGIWFHGLPRVLFWQKISGLLYVD